MATISRTIYTADPFVLFRVTLATGEVIAVWARTQAHAEAYAAAFVGPVERTR